MTTIVSLTFFALGIASTIAAAVLHTEWRKTQKEVDYWESMAAQNGAAGYRAGLARAAAVCDEMRNDTTDEMEWRALTECVDTFRKELEGK